ncbi:hypothetical protein [Photobacterium halotolerans]|nr:hypothetical protein [Photobacterium halotolerans]
MIAINTTPGVVRQAGQRGINKMPRQSSTTTEAENIELNMGYFLVF